jgi:hypothetical protein
MHYQGHSQDLGDALLCCSYGINVEWARSCRSGFLERFSAAASVCRSISFIHPCGTFLFYSWIPGTCFAACRAIVSRAFGASLLCRFPPNRFESICPSYIHLAFVAAGSARKSACLLIFALRANRSRSFICTGARGSCGGGLGASFDSCAARKPLASLLSPQFYEAPVAAGSARKSASPLTETKKM